MNRGRQTIELTTVASAILVFLIGWIAWNSKTIVDIGKQNASIVNWQENTDKNLEDYQKTTDEKLEKISDDSTQIKVDIATIKELTKTLSFKSKIDVGAIEERVRQQIDSENKLASTTAQK